MNPSSNGRANFSIIVPTHNRPEQLSACLKSLACLDYPRDRFEVIVVDDGGKMPAEALIDSFGNEIDVTLLKQSRSGPAAARNAGAARAKGRFLAFTDDDCAPSPDWLRNLAANFARAPDCAVYGSTHNAIPDNPYSTASQLLISYLCSYYNADSDRARFFSSSNLSLSRDLFRSVGGFDTAFTRAAAEDRDLCDRWLQHGYRVIYAPEVLVRHTHPLSLPTFWRQHFNYGRGAFRFHKARARRGGGPIRIEPFKFYLGLLRCPFRQSRRTLLLETLLLISQAANAAGFFWEQGAVAVRSHRARLRGAPPRQRGQTS